MSSKEYDTEEVLSPTVKEVEIQKLKAELAAAKRQATKEKATIASVESTIGSLEKEVEYLNSQAEVKSQAASEALAASTATSDVSPILRVGVLGSTRGTDMQAITDAIANQTLTEVEIVMVCSNRSKAGILDRARTHAIPCAFVSAMKEKADGSGKETMGREEYDQIVTIKLEDAGVHIVLMIGYMRIVSEWFARKWAGRCLNVHPSLLPEFAGGMDTDVHSAVLDAKREVTGCTVHFVTAEVDGGPIVVQMECVVDYPSETADTLKAKVQALEGEAFIRALTMFKNGEIHRLAPLLVKAKRATPASDSTPPPPPPSFAATSIAPTDATGAVPFLSFNLSMADKTLTVVLRSCFTEIIQDNAQHPLINFRLNDNLSVSLSNDGLLLVVDATLDGIPSDLLAMAFMTNYSVQLPVKVDPQTMKAKYSKKNDTITIQADCV